MRKNTQDFYILLFGMFFFLKKKKSILYLATCFRHWKLQQMYCTNSGISIFIGEVSPDRHKPTSFIEIIMKKRVIVVKFDVSFLFPPSPLVFSSK